MVEAGRIAHAQRKFVELHAASKSTIAGTDQQLIGKPYEIECHTAKLDAAARLQQRRARRVPIATSMHDLLLLQPKKTLEGTTTAKALDYSLNRWAVLTRFVDDARPPIDNNHDEQQFRPGVTER